MKNYLKYLNLSVAFLLITSCNSLTYLPADEYEKFTVKANEVFYNNNAAALDQWNTNTLLEILLWKLV